MTDHLPTRRLRLEYPTPFDPVWNPRYPEFACGANSVSLLMPHAEPYFVRSVRNVLDDLDPAQRAEAEAWVRQESQHFAQHRRFNDILLARFGRLARLDRAAGRIYGWLSRTRSSRFNVAFAAGSETIAYGLARWAEAHLDQTFADTEGIASTLFLWHLSEEVEHKSAAFDVFEATDGSRLRYAWAMTVSFVIFVCLTIASTLTMLWSDRRLRNPITWLRLTRWTFSISFELLPTLAASALPGHHPSDFTDPSYLPTWLRQYDPETGTMPLWRQR